MFLPSVICSRDPLPLRTMLRLTEEDLHAIMARSVLSKTPDDATVKQAPGVLAKNAASGEATIGSGADENSHIEKGGLVMEDASIRAARYGIRALLPAAPEFVVAKRKQIRWTPLNTRLDTRLAGWG